MTQSLEDYLEAIYLIIQKKKVARVKDISEQLDVKKPSVINAVKELETRNMVVHEKYGYIELTSLGQAEAAKIYDRHETLRSFLIKVLGLPEDVAEDDACKMEHVLSQQTFHKLKDFMKNH